eukprot:SAG31_NODE_33030_length_348_cov_2.072289_1_plen_25_part_10
MGTALRPGAPNALTVYVRLWAVSVI